jgi:sugar/nucleoside kinase (ribokinase family)
MKYHVITVGSASFDTFLVSRYFKTDFIDGRAHILLNKQKRILAKEALTETGGSALNAAITFARQGLKTACVAKIGDDAAGREVRGVLKKEKVSQNLIICDARFHTPLNVFLVSPYGESTKLQYEEQLHQFSKREINLHKLKSQWLYISSLHGDVKILAKIFEWANKKKLRIAINPSLMELSKPKKSLKLLRQAEIVLFNNEQLQLLSEYPSVESALRSVREAGLKNVVIIDGENGSWVLYNDKIYFSKIYQKVAKIDKTGTEDAYASAFVCSIIKGKSVKEAMTFASANATSAMHYLGSRAGILRKPVLKPIKINVRKI